MASIMIRILINYYNKMYLYWLQDADDCYFIGWRDFKERNIPKLQPNDLVIFIFTETSSMYIVIGQ